MKGHWFRTARMWFWLALVGLVTGSSVIPPGQLTTAQPRPAGRTSFDKTLAERLGYPADAKLLIVHADDLGVSHSEDAASTKAFDSGNVNSGSILVPCPWLTEIADYARRHPEADLGIHLTLTSEWADYRWGPVAPRKEVPSLLDSQGYLTSEAETAAAHAVPREAEIEIRAQIQRAFEVGIRPTHLDTHMRTLFLTKPLFEALLRAGHDYKIPVMIPRELVQLQPFVKDVIGSNDIVLNTVFTIGPGVPPEHWAQFYAEGLKSLKPGVSELVVHIAYDDAEMEAITSGHPNWGAAWRQRDFDFLTSAKWRELLEQNRVTLITWRQIKEVVYPN